MAAPLVKAGGSLRAAAAVLLLAQLGLAFGQANVIPGTDAALAHIGDVAALGREGAFPDGVNGIGIATTVCNEGTVKLPVQAAMLEDHPFFAFLLARESGGRMTQISDRSYVKHEFFALVQSDCDTCQEGPFGGGDLLGLGCSTSSSASSNGDRFWLGPAHEVDPWLGDWEAACSHFDMGEPSVAPPFDCDAARSLTTPMTVALGPVAHRVLVTDAELREPGSFYAQGLYVVRGEPEADRSNNWGTRPFVPAWNGSEWALTPGSGFENGSVLDRWSGATVHSAKNGDDDGRVYVAAKVTGPVSGLYHYEYAVLNRDNRRGVGDLALPVCPSAQIKNIGFSDVDDDPTNDWKLTVNGATLDVDVGENPVRWGSLYNFWFDSDAGPLARAIALDQYEPGAGLATLSVTTASPQSVYNVYAGDGCSFDAEFPSLFATGSPPQAKLGNPTFNLRSEGNEPGALHLIAASTDVGAVPVGGGCTFWFVSVTGPDTFLAATTTTTPDGVADYPILVPSDPSFEGTSVAFQAVGYKPSGGPFLGLFDVTNGLEVRIGDSVGPCP